MIYFDYSASTPVDERVANSFVNDTQKYIGNPNSHHSLGIMCDQAIKKATVNILETLKIDSSETEIIYTSGSSEANNLALFGYCKKNRVKGNHIITTEFEHSSVISPLNKLQNEGFVIDFVKTQDNGTIDIQHLKSLINKETILVAVTAVNSEIGIVNPVSDISKILREYDNCKLFVDMTQMMGKIDINFNDIDMFSFSAHKIYGIKGIGALVKKKNIILEPIIYGGKSTTIYRSGTPSTELICSLSNALKLIYNNIKNDYEYVYELKNYLINNIKDNDNIVINSNENCLPHIINISLRNHESKKIQEYLDNLGIIVSTQTACSSNNSYSVAILKLTNDIELAKSSIRISLSKKTTIEEIDILIKAIREI